MKVILSIFLVILFHLDKSEGLTADSGSECDADAECIPSGDCQYLTDQKEILKKLTDRDQKVTLINKLKAGICNKKDRGFCCPIEKLEPFEPEYKDCGLPQVTVSNVKFVFLLNKSIKHVFCRL